MQTRETGLADLFTHELHRFGSRILGTETPDEIIDREDRKNRAAVDLDIVRTHEVLVDYSRHDLLQILHGDIRVEKQIGVVPPLVTVPVIVNHIMVSPHDVEIHLPIARSLEKTIIQSTLEIRSGIAVRCLVPIPVIDKSVDTVLQGSLDPFFDHNRIIVHFKAPIRLSRLIMAWKSGSPLPDDFPLADALFPEPSVGK